MFALSWLFLACPFQFSVLSLKKEPHNSKYIQQIQICESKEVVSQYFQHQTLSIKNICSPDYRILQVSSNSAKGEIKVITNPLSSLKNREHTKKMHYFNVFSILLELRNLEKAWKKNLQYLVPHNMNLQPTHEDQTCPKRKKQKKIPVTYVDFKLCNV